MTKTLVVALFPLVLAGCGLTPPVGMDSRAPSTLATSSTTQQSVSSAKTSTSPSSSSSSEARRIFDLIDANHDGRLTQQEMVNAPTGAPQGGYQPGQKQAEVKAMFQIYDTNRDGYLSFVEAQAAMTGSVHS